MCDEKSLNDMVEYTLRTGGVSRREFGALTLGAGVTFALPPVANAADTTESEVEIKTADGTADAYFVNPSAGKHPGVLIWPDIFGLRPAFREMGKRLAEWVAVFCDGRKDQHPLVKADTRLAPG